MINLPAPCTLPLCRDLVRQVERLDGRARDAIVRHVKELLDDLQRQSK